MLSCNGWIKRLRLKKHPEGGFYRESYRSGMIVPARALPSRFKGSRAACTAVYYLLAGRDFSAFHRLKSDEIWHFYAGLPLTIHVICRDGKYTARELGAGATRGQYPQILVEAGDWFAAEVRNGNGFALAGCTVAPGFEFADFELGKRIELCTLFPRLKRLITRLTRT